jgi:protein CMS1
LSDAPQEKGHPHTLIVAGAGIRAVDLIRAVRKFQTKEALVAKLFAKHIKLKEAIETVQKARVNIGVGTPQRIYDLLENGKIHGYGCTAVNANRLAGALSASRLERIVVDASHIDQKKRGIMDMKETQVPLMQLLSRGDIKEASGGKVELLFF